MFQFDISTLLLARLMYLSKIHLKITRNCMHLLHLSIKCINLGKLRLIQWHLLHPMKSELLNKILLLMINRHLISIIPLLSNSYGLWYKWMRHSCLKRFLHIDFMNMLMNFLLLYQQANCQRKCNNYNSKNSQFLWLE